MKTSLMKQAIISAPIILAMTLTQGFAGAEVDSKPLNFTNLPMEIVYKIVADLNLMSLVKGFGLTNKFCQTVTKDEITRHRVILNSINENLILLPFLKLPSRMFKNWPEPCKPKMRRPSLPIHCRPFVRPNPKLQLSSILP